MYYSCIDDEKGNLSVHHIHRIDCLPAWHFCVGAVVAEGNKEETRIEHDLRFLPVKETARISKSSEN